MAKYEYEFKKAVVEAYQREEGEYAAFARQYGIPAASTLYRWVKIVKQLGWAGLKRKMRKQTYSSQFKQDVLH